MIARDGSSRVERGLRSVEVTSPTIAKSSAMESSVRAGLVGGALATILTLTAAFSYAALIFSGDLAGGLHYGISAALLAAAILSLAFAFFGTLRFEIGGPGGNQAAIVAVATAAIARALTGKLPPNAIVETVLVAIALSTIATGVFLLILGVTRSGHWLRFVPYPVVGGVLGAAGWLLVTGSLRVIGTSSSELAVGIAFAAVLVIASMRLKHPLALPGVLATGVAGFYAVLAVSGIPVAAARAAGWLFVVPSGSAFANPWDPAALRAVSWPTLAEQGGSLVTLLIVSALVLLLLNSGIEVATRNESDVDVELRVQGIGNVICGLGGGFVGLAALSPTILSNRIAGTSRIPPLFVAAASIATIVGGTGIVEAIPRFVFGALIFSIGFGLLWEWCVRAARRLPFYDYLSILAIIAVVIRFGYVAGVVTGFIIGCIIFVITYSRVHVIKHSLSGTEFRSGIERSPEEKEMLRLHGDRLRVLILQGFIFFGMADGLYRSVKTLIEESVKDAEFLILDFRGVHGLDSSAASSFAKLRRLGEHDAVEVIFSGMSPDVARHWRGAADAEARGIAIFEDLDRALEYCEGRLLSEYAAHGLEQIGIESWLVEELGDTAAARRLIALLEQRPLAAGEVLCNQGEPADAMYFIERGRIDVVIDVGNGKMHRLRSLGDRTILGEMGLYRSRLRTASVVAERASVVYALTRDAFARLEREDPTLAAAFNAAIVRTLADRLEFENGVVAALQR
jgi:sulfate permease, SulP family